MGGPLKVGRPGGAIDFLIACCAYLGDRFGRDHARKVIRWSRKHNLPPTAMTPTASLRIDENKVQIF